MDLLNKLKTARLEGEDGTKLPIVSSRRRVSVMDGTSSENDLDQHSQFLPKKPYITQGSSDYLAQPSISKARNMRRPDLSNVLATLNHEESSSRFSQQEMPKKTVHERSNSVTLNETI